MARLPRRSRDGWAPHKSSQAACQPRAAAGRLHREWQHLAHHPRLPLIPNWAVVKTVGPGALQRRPARASP